MKARVEHVLHRLADRLCAVGAVSRRLILSLALAIVMAMLAVTLSNAVQNRSSGHDHVALTAIQLSDPGVADECGVAHPRTTLTAAAPLPVLVPHACRTA